MRSIDEKLWLGTRNGLVIKSELSHQLFFESDAVSHIIKDSQNNYWVTTLNNGIRFIPNLDLREYQLSEKKIKVNDIITASNEIFAGTERGLFKIEKSQQSEQSNYSLINNDYIKRLRFYDDKLISIGNESIKVYDKNEVQNYTFGANDCYFNGSDYFFSSSVVFKFSESEMRSLRLLQNINSLKKEELEKKTLLKKRTNIIYPSNNDAIILGTSQGLFQYNNNHLTPFVKGFESLNASIKDIKSNKKNNELIVATNSKGLTILKENSILHHISKKQELSSNTCNSIEVVDNTIYVGTNVGIDKITYDDNAFDIENMNTELGLKKEKINDLTIKDSILFIATDKGLLSYNLISGNSKVNRPTLVIDSVLVNNSALPELDKLKSSQNNITVNFTGISFADYGEIKYQYRINNNNWIALDGTVLAIKNISSGSYEIDLRARGNQNIWSDTKRISLTISPPFYKSVPFILLIVISLLLAINFIIRKRIKSLKQTFSKERKVLKEEQQKIQIEKQMLDLEQKALRMQMNPHFIFNALNTIKGYYAAGNIKEANTYISQLSKLLRLILENDERLIPIEKEIEIISLYIKLIQLRYIDVFDYEIIVNPNINKTEVGIPTLILQPLVENAIIHGLAPKEEKGLLTITFDIIESKLICKVIDDGIGYTNTLNKNKNKSGNTSKALKITKERIEIENNDTTTQNFIIKDRVHNTGTEVIIKLPVLKVW